MAKHLLSLYYEVLGSNPVRGGIQLMTMWHFIAQSIALDKALFSTEKYLYFSYFSTKTYVVGTH